MHLGIVTPGFSAHEGDPCIPALLALVRRLSARIAVTVVALRYPGEAGAYSVANASVVSLGWGQRGGWSRLALLREGRRRLVEIHARKPFDALFGVWAHEPGWIVVGASKQLSIPGVVGVFGGELVDDPGIDYGGGRSPLNRLLIRRSLRDADCLTVGSEFLRATVEERRPAAPVKVLSMGIDRDRFGPNDGGSSLRLAGSPSVLFVGSLVPVKDPLLALEAFLELRVKRPEAALHVVGEGPLRSVLEDRIRGLPAGIVRLWGPVSHFELAEHYRAADLCVVSSRFESQCMVALEALASGCRLAGTHVGVLADLAEDVPTAPPGEARALGEAMERALCAWPQGLAARVARDYSDERSASGLLALLADLGA